MPDPKALAERVIEAAGLAADEMIIRFDGTDWAEETISTFIDNARTLCAGKSVKLKGVRVGADIFMRLGGAQGGFVNAQFQNGVPLVQTAEFGTVELVFRP
jgi:hypothetical protein